MEEREGRVRVFRLYERVREKERLIVCMSVCSLCERASERNREEECVWTM